MMSFIASRIKYETTDKIAVLEDKVGLNKPLE